MAAFPLRHLVTATLLYSLTGVAYGQQRRGLTVDDLIRLQRLEPSATVSPDGTWLAITIARPMAKGESYGEFLYDHDRADVWLVSRRTGEKRNITTGATDGSGYWNPAWSPDGRYIALLSTRGGDDVRPYVWERATGTVRRMTERGANLDATGDAVLSWASAYPFMWLDSTTVLCPVRGEGQPITSYQMSKSRMYLTIPDEWRKAIRGIETTASVRESGSDIPPSDRPLGAFVSINVASGEVRELAQGDIRKVLVSPTRRHVALIASTGWTPQMEARSLPQERPEGGYYGLFGDRRTSLIVVSLSGEEKALRVDAIVDPRIVLGGFQSPHSWSRDGSTLAVIGKRSTDDKEARTLWLVSIATRTAKSVDAGELSADATTWCSDGTLLALGRSLNAAGDRRDTLRLDWWKIDAAGRGQSKTLTARLATAPERVLRTNVRNMVLGIASDRIWALDCQRATTRDVTPSRHERVRAFVWPASTHLGNLKDFVVETATNDLERVTLSGGILRTTAFPRPSPRANLVAFVPERELAVFASSERTGMFIWTSDGRSDVFDGRIALNEWLAQIEDPTRLLITYRGLDGDSLRGVVILPVGYQKGRRYPMITWVYAGSVVTDTVSGESFEKHFLPNMNLHLLAAHGYAVLIPSMPLAPSGGGSDPGLDLPKGVIPAVERAIELGFADPQRLGLMGFSYGGYSTYALIAQTHRFRAAVAIAGISDLVSLYGTFDLQNRYLSDKDRFAYSFPKYLESGQGRMGAPHWDDLWRYLRNSPVFYAQRIETPLMLIHGDLDPLPIQQAEEMFTALYRRGQKAKFVRYWGEAHSIASPANIRDMWNRVFDWFDENLAVCSRDWGTATPVTRPGCWQQ